MRSALKLILILFVLAGFSLGPVSAHAGTGCVLSLDTFLSKVNSIKYCLKFKEASKTGVKSQRDTACKAVADSVRNAPWDLAARMFNQGFDKQAEFLNRVNLFHGYCVDQKF